jgi:hypothetical protein
LTRKKTSRKVDDDTTKEDEVDEANKRAIQAVAMMMGRRPSIFGCPAGGPLGGRKTKSVFSILGIGFLVVEVEAWEMLMDCARDDARLILVFRP